MTMLQHAQSLGAMLPPLLIAAERVAQSVYQGVHGRRRAGVGETFWQFRRYETGDSAGRIDWRQSARTDKLFVREREWEATQTASLWADASGSMQFTSDKSFPTKAERAQLLMLALASLCLRGGEKVVWLGEPAVTLRGKNALERLAGQIAIKTPSAGQGLPPHILPRHGQAILCSDFLMPLADLQAQIQRYAASKIRGIFLHILDPMEDRFTQHGRLDVHGLENEAPLLLPDALAVQKAYVERMANHKAQLAHIARSAGWVYLSHVTSAAPHQTLLQLYQHLSVTNG